MSDNTKISWTDSSWPVVTGCDHISEGCENCYAAKLTSGRLKHLPAYAGLAERGRFNGQIRLLPDRLDWPVRWRKPRKIFVSDMADLLHKDVPDEFIARVFAVMGVTFWHTFQELTKRHARLRALLSSDQFADLYLDQYERLSSDLCSNSRWADHFDTWEPRWPLPNVWIGVSAENQKWADIRIPSLLDTPAAVRFVSLEPLLGPIDLRWAKWHPWRDSNHLDGLRMLDWVIVGGESGPGHRPMDLAWLESIVSQCKEAGVPIWVKQDSGPRAGQQGRIPDDLFIQEFPGSTRAAVA